jgi:peptidoglycan-associated lipoprotein
MVRLHVIALATALACAAACSSDPKPEPQGPPAPPAATDGNARAAPPPPRQDTASPTSGSVHIDDKILRACGSIPTAHFAFDSSSVQADAAAALDALAKCFVSGPLAGRSMRLIGHTDPRGEVEYNLALGQRRAGNVGDYLVKRGMEKGHVATSSRGEFDATGTDEEGWARDRKVDVLLVE